MRSRHGNTHSRRNFWKPRDCDGNAVRINDHFHHPAGGKTIYKFVRYLVPELGGPLFRPGSAVFVIVGGAPSKLGMKVYSGVDSMRLIPRNRTRG